MASEALSEIRFHTVYLFSCETDAFRAWNGGRYTEPISSCHIICCSIEYRPIDRTTAGQASRFGILQI